MGFITKRIQNAYIETPAGDLVLSGKAGESPEFKLFTESIEDTDDQLTYDGQMIVSGEKKRSHIQGVFAYADSDIALIQSSVQQAIGTGDGSPCDIVCTDGSIYSNVIMFVGDVMYSGEGTQELKMSAASDWIIS